MSAHWSERREGGGRFALWLIRAICLHLGRRCARVLLYPITLYFFLRRGPERRASYAFLARAFGRRARLRDVLRHLHRYASTILDRAFLLAESLDRFALRVHGLDALEAQLALGRGVLLLGAHIGSFEVLRTLARQRPDLRVCVVMDRRQTPALTDLLHALNPHVDLHIIDAGDDPAQLAFALQNASAGGALIGLLADRARPGQMTVRAQFFDAAADFPASPYLLASLLEIPVTLSFGLYRGGNRYDLYFETFAQKLKIARATRAADLRAAAQRYAARLEHYTRLDPYNWFNFYDFWHARADRDPAAERRAAVAGSGGSL